MKKKKSYFDEDNYLTMTGIMDAQVMFKQFACKYCGAYAEKLEDIVHFPACTLKEVVNAEGVGSKAYKTSPTNSKS